MNDRPGGGERVVLVHVNFPIGKMAEDLDEFQELALSAGAEIVAIVSGTRRVPEAKYFVGSGKAEEIAIVAKEHAAQLVIFNHALSPAQERNLEHLLQCRVLDRTGLILDIFAQRARSFEGKLQVELALLKHLSTRLIRGWTHLERQRGGIGLRGPGETQLEVDRRLIRNRIKLISVRLAKIRRQRASSRRARQKAVIPTIALVGYTNAGKSTLFNKLTGAFVYVANQLFATLDPILRRIEVPGVGPIIIADTVGFIRHLPHDLVEAFHATLEEVSSADLLLHVVDVNDEKRAANIEQVNQVLSQIGASHVPCLLVYNKIDLIAAPTALDANDIENNAYGAFSPEIEPKIDRDQHGHCQRVYLSAITGAGMDLLFAAISEMLDKELIERDIILQPEEAKLRANLYQQAAVLAEKIGDDGSYHLTVRLPRIELEKLFRFR